MALDLKIIFPDGAEFSPLRVTPVGENQYRAEESAMPMGESEEAIHFGDVIELELISENVARYKRLVAPSFFETGTYLVSADRAFTAEFSEFAERLARVGGHYELFSMGVLLVHLPWNVRFDVEGELGKLPPATEQSREEFQRRSREAGGTRDVSAIWPIRK